MDTSFYAALSVTGSAILHELPLRPHKCILKISLNRDLLVHARRFSKNRPDVLSKFKCSCLRDSTVLSMQGIHRLAGNYVYWSLASSAKLNDHLVPCFHEHDARK